MLVVGSEGEGGDVSGEGDVPQRLCSAAGHSHYQPVEKASSGPSQGSTASDLYRYLRQEGSVLLGHGGLTLNSVRPDREFYPDLDCHDLEGTGVKIKS